VEIKLKCSPSANGLKQSTFVFPRAKSAIGYHACLAKLIEIGFPEDQAEATMEKAYEDGLKLMSGEVETVFRIPTINEQTRKLFNFFKWWSNPDGTRAEYVVDFTSGGKQVILTSDPYTTATAIIVLDPDGGESRTLEMCMQDEYEKLALKNVLSFLDVKAVDENGVPKRTVELPSLFEYWETVKPYWARDSWFRLANAPVNISSDKEEATFFYFDSTTISEGPCPKWTEWMEVFPEYAKPVFRAWMWSIFDAKNKGRQAMWLQDQGYTGKSSMISALTKFVGHQTVAAISKDSLGNQFGYSTIYGRRLAVFGDSKNPKLLHDSKIHSILGGDVVSVERKNVQAFSAQVHAKILIGSNHTPEIDLGARSEITRILYIPLHEPSLKTMKKFCKVDERGKIMRQEDGTPVFIGGHLEDELFAEIGHFLFSCQKDYDELCPNRKDILMPKEMYHDLTTRCASPEHMEIEKFVSTELVFDINATVEPGELMEKYREHQASKKGSHFDFSRLKTYLETKHQVKFIVRGEKRYLLGVTLGTPVETPMDERIPVGLE